MKYDDELLLLLVLLVHHGDSPCFTKIQKLSFSRVLRHREFSLWNQVAKKLVQPPSRTVEAKVVLEGRLLWYPVVAMGPVRLLELKVIGI